MHSDLGTNIAYLYTLRFFTILKCLLYQDIVLLIETEFFFFSKLLTINFEQKIKLNDKIMDTNDLEELWNLYKLKVSYY